MKKNLLLTIYSVLITGTIAFAGMRQGDYQGRLTANDSIQIPVRMSFLQATKSGVPMIAFINGDERIVVDPNDIKETKDSLHWLMPVFDSEFKCKKLGDSILSGVWFNRSRTTKNKLAFRAVLIKNTTEVAAPLPTTFAGDFFAGKWETTFTPNSKDSSKAIGLFRRGKNPCQLVGTFLTETGDYRFLEGTYNPTTKRFWLSCFDGSHAFYFEAVKGSDGILRGNFWSGAHWHESWIAKNNPAFALRDPEQLTFITDSSKIGFTFRDLQGKEVSLSDERFKGKVVIIQITGSWCPNCMDETAWLSKLHKQYNHKGLEVVALCYEKSKDTAVANRNIRRVRDRYQAEYTFLNTGKSGNKEASESLPFINGVGAFPTTIFIDREGKVRKIHTGFTGPGTGKAYDTYTFETMRFVLSLLR